MDGFKRVPAGDCPARRTADPKPMRHEHEVHEMAG